MKKKIINKFGWCDLCGCNEIFHNSDTECDCRQCMNLYEKEEDEGQPGDTGIAGEYGDK